MKLSSAEDAVLGFRIATGDRDLLRVETSRGAEVTISSGRTIPPVAAARGASCCSGGSSRRVLPIEVENPQPLDGSS